MNSQEAINYHFNRITEMKAEEKTFKPSEITSHELRSVNTYKKAIENEASRKFDWGNFFKEAFKN